MFRDNGFRYLTKFGSLEGCINPPVPPKHMEWRKGNSLQWKVLVLPDNILKNYNFGTDI